MNRTRNLVRIGPALAACGLGILCSGCATTWPGSSGPAETTPAAAQYYDEQIRILRDRVAGLELEVERNLDRAATQPAGPAPAELAARVARVEARLDALEAARASDRAAIVDEVVAEIERMLAGSATAAGGAPTAAGGTYTVQKGDTLWSIAQRHGTTVRELQAINGMSDTDVLRIGQVIRIP